jgi:hypothetical protein
MLHRDSVIGRCGAMKDNKGTDSPNRQAATPQSRARAFSIHTVHHAIAKIAAIKNAIAVEIKALGCGIPWCRDMTATTLATEKKTHETATIANAHAKKNRLNVCIYF